MGNIATWAAVFPAALILLFLLYKKIRSDYRKFCIEEDEREETEKIVSKINALRETVLRSGDDALKANLLAKIDLWLILLPLQLARTRKMKRDLGLR